ncbi:recombinase family protein [Chloroflexota bacterium]
MEKALTIIRVSGEDQLRGYGPDSQWCDDVLPNAELLGLQVNENLKRVIQEPATGWDREEFEAAVREALDLYHRGDIQALVFPRVDRETRFLFGSFPLLCEVIRAGMRVYFARERFHLDPNDSEAVSRYLRKAEEAQAYVETMRLNTMRGRRRRAEQDHMMPSSRSKFAHDYHPYRREWGRVPDTSSGRYTVNQENAAWVRRWVDWLLTDGLSLNKCCKIMLERYGIRVYRTTMVNILGDPALIGKFYAYRTQAVRDHQGRYTKKVDEKDWLLIYEDPAQAIITPEQFYALQERFKLNRQNSSRNTKYWYPPLRSLIFHSCGRRMAGTYRNGQPMYRCLPCGGAWINAGPLWEQIQRGVKEQLLDPERLVPAIEAQLDSGQSMGRLEEELKSNRQRLEMLNQAEKKALRFHLYLPDYPPEKLADELRRISDQRKELLEESSNLERQLAELRQAVVDGEGLRIFCEIATRNLDSLGDSQWRLILEAMHLQILVNGDAVTVKAAVPAVKDENSAIVLCTSRSSYWLHPLCSPSSEEPQPPVVCL